MSDKIKTFRRFITEDKRDIVMEKMNELNSKMYSLNASRERRIDGYIMFRESSRNCRFKKTSDGTDFYIEVVNKSDESFVADIGSCMSKTIEEMIDLIKEF